MRRKIFRSGCFCGCLVMLLLALAQPVAAEKPAWSGEGGKGAKKEKIKGNKGGSSGSSPEYSHNSNRVEVNVYFTDRHRSVVREYYHEQYRSGHCPPGLAKKNNGCLPPGQAKKWRVGYPLPRDIVVYDLPVSIVRQLGYPPAGHKYVRVASDILMIAVGTGLIVDAIEDLSSM